MLTLVFSFLVHFLGPLGAVAFASAAKVYGEQGSAQGHDAPSRSTSQHTH